MFDLAGRIALVTGASGGIGQAIARAFYLQGASVALSGTRMEALESLAEELKVSQPRTMHPNQKVAAFPCDLADSKAVENLVPQAEAALGPLDILVNNAGITQDNLFLRMKDEEWEKVIAVNLNSVFRLSRSGLKGMLKRRYGRIIGVTSVVGVTGNAGQANYAASKAGMIGMFKSLAAEVASRSITVNCIAPGFIETPMTGHLNEKQRASILSTIPAGRLGTSEEVAAAALYLASSEASYMSGQTLHVNGGMAMI